MSPSIAALLSQIDLIGQDLAVSDSPEKQAKLRAAALNLSAALEPDSDIVERISFQYLDNVAIRIAIQLNLFEILVKSEKPKSLVDIFEITKADPILLRRLLNHLTTMDAVAQVGKDLFRPSRKSKIFAIPHQAAALKFCFDFNGPVWQETPSFLTKTNYVNPTDPLKCATQAAYKTDDHFFRVMIKRPPVFDTFNLWMTGYHDSRASWLDSYPFRERIIDSADTGEPITFVDVGSGRGHEAMAVKNRFPGLMGRLVIQDLPQVFKTLDGPSSDIEVMPHDFFSPQPVKGAKVYFFRHIFHAFSNDSCLKFLARTRDAMTPTYSRILISDWIVPSQISSNSQTPSETPPQLNTSNERDLIAEAAAAAAAAAQATRDAPLPPTFATAMDMNMLSVTGGQERTEVQWQELMQRAGLRIVGFWGPRDGRGTGIVEVVRDS
ncbi:MAG: hypothetical protein MMC33_004556 [Icmadophila ericetorum]|nr:hypothetical protein [Icmadophila ericetorum]